MSVMSEQFAVALTPLPTAARVAKHRSAIRWRVISAIVSLAILIAIVVFLDPGWSEGWTRFFFILWGVTTAAWMTVTLLSLHRAKKDLASISHGDAIRVTRRGLEFLHPRAMHADWADITALKITGASLGAGPKLVMEVDGKPAAQVPMSFLDAMPSAIDSAVSAHSLGRVRLDVSDMDRML